MEKECSKCKATKDISEFHRNKSKPDGRTSSCRTCCATYKRIYRQEHGVQERQRQRERRANNIVVEMLRAARNRSRRKNIEFGITLDDIKLTDVCPYLDIPLSVASGSAADNSYSLDRIRPDKGYVPGNIIVCSNRANQIKNNATPEELMLVAEKLKTIICQSDQLKPSSEN